MVLLYFRQSRRGDGLPADAAVVSRAATNLGPPVDEERGSRLSLQLRGWSTKADGMLRAYDKSTGRDRPFHIVGRIDRHTAYKLPS